MTKWNYYLTEMTSQKDHVECCIQLHMRLHNKSREQNREILPPCS
jgi:hypothetical protein